MPPEIESRLAPGEKLLWHGRPRPYVFMLRGIHSILYGATWSILGAFWYYGSGGIGENSAFEGWWKLIPTLSLPFIFAGFSFFFYPIKLGIKARRTWYGVTTQRIFIAELQPKGAPLWHEFSEEELAAPQVVKRFDGLYDVILTHRAQSNPHLQPQLDAGFFGIADGECCARQLAHTRKTHSSQPPSS